MSHATGTGSLCIHSSHIEPPPCPEDRTTTLSHIQPPETPWAPAWAPVLPRGHLGKVFQSKQRSHLQVLLHQVPHPTPRSQGPYFLLNCIHEFSLSGHYSDDGLFDIHYR